MPEFPEYYEEYEDLVNNQYGDHSVTYQDVVTPSPLQEGETTTRSGRGLLYYMTPPNLATPPTINFDSAVVTGKIRLAEPVQPAGPVRPIQSALRAPKPNIIANYSSVKTVPDFFKNETFTVYGVPVKTPVSHLYFTTTGTLT